MRNTNADSPVSENHFPTDDKKDYVQKELDQIQGIIGRMAANSFQCKGWAIGIISLILALGKDSFLLSGPKVLVLLLPIAIFWYLDAFFLYTEQRYRDLFNDVIKRRFNKMSNETDANWDHLFDYNYTRFEDFRVFNGGIWRHLRYSFVFGQRIDKYEYDKHLKGINNDADKKQKEQELLEKAAADRLKSKKNIPTHFRVMWSKTLWPFYFVPVVFVAFAFLQGQFGLFGQAIEKKEPVTVQIDSSTLIPILKALDHKAEKPLPHPLPPQDSTPKPPGH